MFDRLVERFCEFDDFCNAVRAEWKAMLLSNSKAADRQYGPEGGLADSEIMTVLVLYHSSRFKNFKTFYNGIVLGLLRACFPGAPCYERFIALTSRVWTLLVFFLASRMGRKTDIYYIDSTPLPVCHQQTHRQTQGFHWPGGKRKDQHGLVFRLQIAYRVQPSARDRRAQTDTRQCSRHNARARIDQGPERQALWRQGLYRPKTRARASAPRAHSHDARSLQHEIPASFFPTKPCSMDATSPRRSSATSRNFPRSGCRNIARSSTPSPTLPPRSSPTRSIPCLRDLSASSCHS